MGFVTRVFYRVGHFAASRPYLTIVAAALVIAVGCVGFYTLKVTNSPQKLWVDPGSTTNKQQDYFDNHYGKFFRTEQINFVARDGSETTDLFQKEYLEEVWDLQSQIENQEVLFQDRVYTLDYYCYKPVIGKGCYISSPMDYWKMNLTAMQDDPNIKYTAQCTEQVTGTEIPCSDRNEIPIIRSVVFGGVTCETGSKSGCEACKINAKMLVVTMLLNADDSLKEGAEFWENHVFEEKISTFNADDSKLLKVNYMAERSINDELTRETQENMWYVVGSYVAMFLYLSMAIGTLPSLIHTRFLVGFGGIAIVICSACFSIGVTSWSGMYMSMISVEVIPFLILAIGVDNMFLISTAFKRAKEKLRKKTGQTPETNKALGMALMDVGPSITAAAFSEFMAFIVGTTTNVPALTDFCLQAAIAVVTDYALQFTVFIAILSIDERRKKARRLDCIPCFDLVHSPKESNRDIVKWFVRNYYAPVIFHPITQVALVLTFVGVIVLSFAGFEHLHMGLDPQVTAIEGSNLFHYFDQYMKWGEAGPIAYVIFKNVNYTNPHNLMVLDQMSDAIAEIKKTVQPPVYSWVKSFAQYRVDGGTWEYVCNTTNISEYDFNTQLRMFLQVRIESDCCKKYGICGEQYEKDIVWGADGNVLTSRYRFQHKALITQKQYIDGYKAAKNAVENFSKQLVPYLTSTDHMSTYSSDSLSLAVDWSSSSDPYTNGEDLAYAYSLFYVYYDQYNFIQGVCFQNFLLTCAAVFFAIELLTTFYCALLVSILVGTTTWGMIGGCYLWNTYTITKFTIEVNAVSVVNMITCAGFAVEFCIHISTKFLRSKGTRKHRANKALVEMGSTIIAGIVITKLIGVSVLGLAPSMIFNLYYFRMYFCIFFLGVFHGLAFQPFLLSYIGPPSYREVPDKKLNAILGISDSKKKLDKDELLPSGFGKSQS